MYINTGLSLTSLTCKSHIDPCWSSFSEFGCILMGSWVKPQLQAMSTIQKYLQMLVGECRAEPWLQIEECCCLWNMFWNSGLYSSKRSIFWSKGHIIWQPVLVESHGELVSYLPFVILKISSWMTEFEFNVRPGGFMVLAQIICIKKPKGVCPVSVPKGRARQENVKMSQEVGVSALGVATADKASGHVLVLCKPSPLATCVSVNCQLSLNMGNATSLTPGNPIPALPHISSFAIC